MLHFIVKLYLVKLISEKRTEIKIKQAWNNYHSKNMSYQNKKGHKKMIELSGS